MSDRPTRIYFVLGEESGDALGADLFAALQRQADEAEQTVEISGLAGERLQAAGMSSLFDIDDIAVMGLTAVAARLPSIVRRVYQTVADIEREKPDAIVLIDSPDFTHAVAKRVRKKLPATPILNYVCPSVWAWRSGRARRMRAYIDHVLTLLPFEPDALKRLDGPPGTYVGHPLATRTSGTDNVDERETDSKPKLLVLPGSRNTELKQLLSLYGEVVETLEKRGLVFDLVLPTVSRLRERIEQETASWAVQPDIRDSGENQTLFAGARAALIASGTVSLELAVHGVPHVSGYRFDAITSPFLRLLNTWSANLPNLIADQVIVPEEINGMVMPERMARHVEAVFNDGPARQHQIEGFKQVRARMKTKRPAGELAAEIVFNHIKR